MGERQVTINEALDPRRNSLNALRLLFAGMVLYAHTYALLGHREPRLMFTNLGGLGVAGFFAISGYLITRSRAEQKSGARFLWHRVLRIYPSYWGCLVATAFVFAPIAYLIEHHGLGGFPVTDAAKYAGENATLSVRSFAIPGTLTSTPVPGAWDGSLWTLAYEMACYLAVFALAAVGLLRRHVIGSMLAGLMLFAYLTPPWDLAAYHPLWQTFSVQFAVPLALSFLAGAALYVYGDRVPCSGVITVATTLLYVGARHYLGATSDWIAQPALAYVVMWLGIRLPFGGLFAVNDVSYGVYLYAFPIQQLLVVAGVGNVAALMVLAVPLTVAAGALNRLAVEKPANKLKRLRSGVVRGHAGSGQDRRVERRLVHRPAPSGRVASVVGRADPIADAG